MSCAKKVLGYKPVGSSYNKKPKDTSEADWAKVLTKRKSDRRNVKHAHAAKLAEKQAADVKLVAEQAAENKRKRDSLAVDPVDGPTAVRHRSPVGRVSAPTVDLASLDEQLTQRCSPERSARSPSPQFSGGDEASWDMQAEVPSAEKNSGTSSLVSGGPAQRRARVRPRAAALSYRVFRRSNRSKRLRPRGAEQL